MKLIAHRGNWKGRVEELENSLFLLDNAICKGFDVEVDVWKLDDDLFFGHNGPEIPVSAGIIQLLSPYAGFMRRTIKLWSFSLEKDITCSHTIRMSAQSRRRELCGPIRGNLLDLRVLHVCQKVRLASSFLRMLMVSVQTT